MDTLDRSLTYTAGGVGPAATGPRGHTALSMVVAGDGKLVAFAAYAGGLGSRCDYIVDVADLRSAIIGTGASGGQISSAGDWEASRPTFPRGGCRAMASGGDLVWDQTDVTWSNPFSFLKAA